MHACPVAVLRQNLAEREVSALGEGRRRRGEVRDRGQEEAQRQDCQQTN